MIRLTDPEASDFIATEDNHRVILPSPSPQFRRCPVSIQIDPLAAPRCTTEVDSGKVASLNRMAGMEQILN